MGATGKLFKEIGYLIPDVDRRRVDRLARLLDGTEGMAIQGAAGSTGVIYVPGSPTGNPRYFKLSGETNAANSWGGAGYFQYSDNGSTLVTQIDDAGYIFNEQGGDIDFRIEGDTDANLFTLDAGSDVIALGGAVNASYKLKVYGSTAIDKTYTAATAGEHIVKITATDSVTQTAGMLQTLLVDHNITGVKSGSAHSEGISVDMNIGSNTNTAYASAVYISQSGNPNSSVIEGMNIYLEDMGSGTLSNILGLDIGINSTNVASARHAGMRIRNHSGTAPDAILIETGFTNVLTINPGVDANINLIKLGIGGTPTIGWAETPDVFTSNKGWNITGASTIGDGGTTNYAAFAADGDLTFVGTAGLVFGELYVAAAGDELTITTAGQVNKIQITSFDTAGVSNNMTPSAASDDITVLVAGMYLCTVSLHIESAAAGGADIFGFSVYKNDGDTEFANVHGHRQLAGGGVDVGSVSLSGIIDLAEDDTIELWTWNEDSTDNIIVQDVTLSLVMIGGT